MMLVDFTQLLLGRRSISINSEPEEQISLSINRLHIFYKHLQCNVISQTHVQREVVKAALVGLIPIEFLNRESIIKCIMCYMQFNIYC